MKKRKEKKIELKNYIYSILILAGGILLVIYIFSWYNVKKEEKLMNSYLISSKTIESKINNLNDLEQTIKEAPLSYFVLVSYTGNEDVYNMEKKLKRIIDKYKINDIIYYVDASNNINSKEYLDELGKLFNIKEVTKIPVLIYIEEGKVKDVTSILTVDNIKKLLDENDFELVK
jgi:hypothetical protein